MIKNLPSKDMLRMLQNSMTIEVNGTTRHGYSIVSNKEFEAKEIIPQGRFGSNVQREFLHNTCLVYQTSANSAIFVAKGFGNRTFRRLVTRPDQTLWKDVLILIPILLSPLILLSLKNRVKDKQG